MKLRAKCLALLTLFCTATLFNLSAADKLKVGFVYINPITDHGWDYQHDQGRLFVENKLGDQVSTTFVEKVPEGSDAERVIRQLASQGHDLIFTTSFGYMNPTIKVAKRFPKVKFEHVTGYKRSRNVSTYNARFYEGRYVAAVAAASVSKSKIFGYIASFPIPEVIRGINSTAISARKINPDIEIRVIWLNTWYDPAKEADAAKALIDQGADVLFQHTDSPAPLQIAESRGVYGIGQASDMKDYAPNAQLTAIINNWGPLYVRRVQAVLDGTWKPADSWEGLKTGLVQMAPYNKKLVNRDVRKKAQQTEKRIIEGSLHPFAGPLKKQDGTMVIGAGKTLTDAEMLGMNYYVEGIVGQLPQ